jgi:hypothetical protein
LFNLKQAIENLLDENTPKLATLLQFPITPKRCNATPINSDFLAIAKLPQYGQETLWLNIIPIE